MLIRLGCELEIASDAPTTMLALVHPHGSRRADLEGAEVLRLAPERPAEVLMDGAGNRWCRFRTSPGVLRFGYASTLRDGGLPDLQVREAVECPVGALPIDAYRYLNPSRYCDSERLADVAWRTFGSRKPGWERVQAICDWVHGRIRFDHGAARADRTASGALEEGAGVCRDYAHLAIALCRCLNIPARYATGYLGYTGVPPGPDPIDFSAWFEAYLGDRWYTFDPRYNVPRIGRVLIGRGRDAADVPFLRSFGPHRLDGFRVIVEARPEAVAAIPEPVGS